MQSLRPVEPFPFTAFRQSYGSTSDPLRFCLHRSDREASCAETACRASYPSPPMSGSLSPQGRPRSPLDAKRKRSNSSSAPQQDQHSMYASYFSKLHGTFSATGESRPPVAYQPKISMLSQNEQLHQLPGLGAAPSIPHRQGANLHPRPTRRAKAHVASACVNCKRKHLGCDSARPCQRCKAAGKESSCIDVTHKRRGRPPLKAEEGPVRGYEPSLGQSSTLRLSQANGHGQPRAAASRKIRPSTEVPLSAPLEHGRGGSSLRLITPNHGGTAWGAPFMLPSPSASLPPSSPSNSLPLQRPATGATLPHPSVAQSSNEVPQLPPLQFGNISRPSYPSAHSMKPAYLPANSAIRLPSLPRLRLDCRSAIPQTGSATSSPWSARADLSHRSPISPLTQDEAGGIARRWSHEQPLVSSPVSLPPIRQSEDWAQRHRCFSVGTMVTPGHRDILNSPPLSEGTSRSGEDQPTKRQRMEIKALI